MHSLLRNGWWQGALHTQDSKVSMLYAVIVARPCACFPYLDCGLENIAVIFRTSQCLSGTSSRTIWPMLSIATWLLLTASCVSTAVAEVTAADANICIFCGVLLLLFAGCQWHLRQLNNSGYTPQFVAGSKQHRAQLQKRDSDIGSHPHYRVVSLSGSSSRLCSSTALDPC